MMELTMYHKLLRIASVVIAFVLMFQSGIVSETTAKLSLETQQFVANAVAVSVGVEPTELNQITADLTKRELALAAREKDVTSREISVGIAPGGAMLSQTTTTFVLATVLFVLLVLVILNYILDYLRAKRTRSVVTVTV